MITGGEMTLDMLDLVYNKTARTYQAPLQLQSTDGIFIVDDLGRQIDPPKTLVNCWKKTKISLHCNQVRNLRSRLTPS